MKLAEGQNGSVLRREGTILLDSLDGTYIALLPASRIPAMASGEQVVAMEAHERSKVNMDVTHITTGANKVQAGSTVGDKTIPAYTGKGVVVGISDAGFDYTHPMFFVALWLQAKPTLTREEVITTLSYGEVDAYAGLLDILGVTTAIPTLSQKLAGVTLQGRTLCIEGITEPTTVNIYTLNGQKVFSTQTADGRINLPSLPAAVYAVQCGTLGSSLIRM